ncbi:MAG: divergent polysaccharide deacetylase family protein [Desulfatiglandaceae bacterium]
MKRKKKKHGPVLILAVSVPALLIFVLVFFLFIKGVAKPDGPLYEEAYSSSPELVSVIGRIDRCVYESLYQSGIPERDIFFLDVEPRHEKGKTWEFTRLLVKCADETKALRVGKRILKELLALGPGVTAREEPGHARDLRYRVLANGLYTHSIVLRFSGTLTDRGKGRPKVALIIDDLGYDPGLAEAFMGLDIPVSLSVLPSAPFTRRIVREAHKRGFELMLHLPMEPKNYPAVNPGPGTLFVSMDDQVLLRKLAEDLKQIPGAVGVNNHMGSLFTEDRDKMIVVLGALRKLNLFFVDSRTTPGSVAYDLARRMDVPTAKRTVFLDNDLDAPAMEFQVRRLLNMARHRGWAIGIGHPHKATVGALKNYLEKRDDGIEIVPVSELVG